MEGISAQARIDSICVPQLFSRSSFIQCCQCLVLREGSWPRALALAITPPVLPRLAHRARADASRCAPLARRRRRRGVSVVSFASPAMAATPLSRSCPIRIISGHLLDAAGQLLRVLFLDREGHISAQPHDVPREQALILAANQQRVLGPQAEVRVL